MFVELTVFHNLLLFCWQTALQNESSSQDIDEMPPPYNATIEGLVANFSDSIIGDISLTQLN